MAIKIDGTGKNYRGYWITGYNNINGHRKKTKYNETLRITKKSQKTNKNERNFHGKLTVETEKEEIEKI